MLSKPEYGWSNFYIGNDHEYELSYLTDVPFDWLEQAIHGLETMQPFAVHGFCEPGRMVCLVSYHICYIVFEIDGLTGDKSACKEMYGVNLSMMDFCRTLYNDINENIDDWSRWYLHDLDDEEEMKEKLSLIIERKSFLKEQLDKLEALINVNAVRWTPRHCFF
jgi:hypothetical protein